MASESANLLPRGKDTRVGIIGGGPSGLAAAWFLMKKGYTNVTVLEKAPRVGGKCETVEFTDSKGLTHNYELGAEYVTYAYDIIYSFMKEVGVDWVESGPIVAIMGNGNFAEATQLQPMSKTLPALMRYLGLVIKYRKVIAEPGNGGIAANPELSQSSGDFIKKHNLEALKGIFVVRQFGYGTFESFPAIHLLRTIPLPTLARIIIEQIPLLRSLWKRPVASLALSGTQGLFEKVAEKLGSWKEASIPNSPAVLTGQEVIRITKDTGSGALNVQTNVTTHVFDKVICAIPPNFLAGMMDFPEDEKALFMKTKFHSYWVGCLEFDRNMPKNYYQNLILNDDEPVQFSKRWTDSNIIAYGYNWLDAPETEDPVSSEKLEKVLKKYVKDNFLVDQYSHMPTDKFWPTYHPHVPIKDLQNGYYDKLEALQGKYGIYLTGDSMACESMEYSCKYSKQLVDRFF